MHAATVLKAFNNKTFLFVAVLVFFLPFIVFCFWNIPAADDFMILHRREQYSFWGLQNFVYHKWTGRYFSTFVSTLFSYSGFLYSHYFLHTLLLFASTILSWFFCLNQVNKYCVRSHFSRHSLLVISLFLMVLEINVIPEPVTAFYWFSSAITYQLPLILLILLIGILIRMVTNESGNKINLFFACLLVILLNGCNESITLFILAISTCGLAYDYWMNRKLRITLLALYLLNLLSSFFLLFAPGIIQRASLIKASAVVSVMGISIGKFAVLNWFFLKEPLWWFFLLLAVYYLAVKDGLGGDFIKRHSKWKTSGLLSFYVLAGLCIYFPILYVSNGSLPLRAENIICFLFSLILLLIVSISIARRMDAPASSVVGFYPYRFLIGAILMFSSGNMKNVASTLLSGYFYKQVMLERLNLFDVAKQKDQREVLIDDYEIAVSQKINAYPLFDRQLLREIVLHPPPIICFESNLTDWKHVKELYHVERVTIKGR